MSTRGATVAEPSLLGVTLGAMSHGSSGVPANSCSGHQGIQPVGTGASCRSHEFREFAICPPSWDDHESTLFHGLNAQGRHEPHPRSPVDVWEDPDARFSWTPNAIKLYVHREQWESVFNALVLLGDSDRKSVGA
jgi:hypothetical protein